VPELPDVALYVEALASRVGGAVLEALTVQSVSLLRSVDPAPARLEGRRVTEVRRLGKRVVIALDDDHFVVIHLMIAGRLHWRAPSEKPFGRKTLARLAFSSGTLSLTEAGTKRRATLHLVHGEDALRAHDPGGEEPLALDLAGFRAALLRERHTLKRALTDPHLFSGIGNAYSDEILHRARLSPLQLTTNLDDTAIAALHAATRGVLEEWTERLRREADGRFPEKVTAFRPEMAVHGRYRAPCPVCGAPVQRIVHGEHETNYCARCQTGGRLLADRALSRLLHEDWPRTLEQLEARRERAQAGTNEGGRK
jgi:formamidopyrimidine-DNA glycosylase